MMQGFHFVVCRQHKAHLLYHAGAAQPMYQLFWQQVSEHNADTDCMCSCAVVATLDAMVAAAAAACIYNIMNGKQRLTSLLTFIAGRPDIGNINWAK
jgi:hypothetical protein